MIKLSAILILVTAAGVARAETDAHSTSNAPAPALSSEDSACSALSAMGASLTSSDPTEDIVTKANALAETCGTTISPKCQTAFRTWKLKAPDTKFFALDGCQDVSSLNLGAACAQTVSQTLFTDKQIANERKELGVLADKLQAKGSILIAKKKGCPEAYYRLRIQDLRTSLQDLHKELSETQAMHDRYATGFFRTPRYIKDTVVYDSESLYSAVFKGVGPGPYLETRKRMVSDIQSRIDVIEAAILKEQLGIGLANKQAVHASSASVEDMQADRDEAFAAYFKQREVVRRLMQQQLQVIDSDTTCSETERSKIRDEEFDRVSGIGGIPALDKENLEIEMRDLEVPVKADRYAQTIASEGCAASR